MRWTIPLTHGQLERQVQSVDKRAAVRQSRDASALGRGMHWDWLGYTCTYPSLHMRVMKGIPVDRPLLASSVEHNPKQTAATPSCVQLHTTHLCL